jgi:hypothetical protein
VARHRLELPAAMPRRATPRADSRGPPKTLRCRAKSVDLQRALQSGLMPGASFGDFRPCRSPGFFQKKRQLTAALRLVDLGGGVEPRPRLGELAYSHPPVGAGAMAVKPSDAESCFPGSNRCQSRPG